MRGGMTFSANPPRCFFDYYILGAAECFGEAVLDAPDRLHILVRDIPGVIGDRAFVSRDCRLCFHLVRVSGAGLNCALSAFDPSTGRLGPPLWFTDPPIDSQYYSCDWAPDFNRFAFVDIGSRGRSVRDEGSPLYVMDVKRLILADEYLATGIDMRGVAWSPDGRWIAFRVSHVHPADSHMFSAVCVLDLSSGRAWRLSQCDGRPQWAPDMAYLVYERDGYIFRLDWRRALADNALEFPIKHQRLDGKPEPSASPEKDTGTHLMSAIPAAADVTFAVREQLLGKPAPGVRFDRTDLCVGSPDGKHAACPAQQDGKWLLLLDGKSGQAYDNIVSMAFDSRTVLCAIGTRGDAVYRVELTITSRP